VYLNIELIIRPCERVIFPEDYSPEKLFVMVQTSHSSHTKDDVNVVRQQMLKDCFYAWQ